MPGLAFDKFADGKTHRDVLRETRAARRQHEDEIRKAVQRRDHGTCRIPGCRERGQWAHLNHRKMGGNRDGSRSTTETTLLLCFNHHQGPVSVDRGGIEVIPLTDAGCDGPCAYHWRETGVTLRDPAR